MDESIAGCEHCNGTGVTSDAHTGGGVWDSLGSLGNAFGNAASGFTGALGQAGTAFGQNLLQQGQAAYGNARGAVNGAVNGFAQQGRDAYGNAQAAANGYAQQGRAALGNAQAYGQNLAQQGAQFGQNAAQQGAQYGQNFAQRGVNALNNGAVYAGTVTAAGAPGPVPGAGLWSFGGLCVGGVATRYRLCAAMGASALRKLFALCRRMGGASAARA